MNKAEQKQYERKIGTRTIMGTDWPIHLIVFRAGRRWAVAERCNGTCRNVQHFQTKSDAINAADERTPARA